MNDQSALSSSSTMLYKSKLLLLVYKRSGSLIIIINVRKCKCFKNDAMLDWMYPTGNPVFSSPWFCSSSCIWVLKAAKEKSLKPCAPVSGWEAGCSDGGASVGFSSVVFRCLRFLKQLYVQNWIPFY